MVYIKKVLIFLYNLKKLVISILIEHISNDLIIVKKANVYKVYFNNIAITIKTQNEHLIYKY